MKKAIIAGVVIAGVVGIYGAIEIQKKGEKGDDWSQFEDDAPAVETVKSTPPATKSTTSAPPAVPDMPVQPNVGQPNAQTANSSPAQSKPVAPESEPLPDDVNGRASVQAPDVEGLTPDGGIGYFDPDAKGPEYGVDQNVHVDPPGADWDGNPGLPPEAGVDQTITVEPPGAGSQNMQTLGPAGEMPQ